MRFLIALFALWPLLPAGAVTQLTQTQIYDIDYGQQITDEPLVLLTNGRVVKLRAADPEMLARFKRAQQQESWVDLTINEEREILQLKTLETPVPKRMSPMVLKRAPEQFIPSVLGGLDFARTYHRSSRRWLEGETQCFNRAHVWSYDWWKKNNFLSMKMFIFFTRKYIRQYNFEWWFHVAPYLHVNVEGRIRERMMDIRYTRGPVTVKQWSDIFMRNKADCLVITKYSEYANFPETGDCYLYRTPMFYYQPVDMEMEEAWGTQKTHWVDWEVREAFREAFGVRI
jgi:hypothetical protein